MPPPPLLPPSLDRAQRSATRPSVRVRAWQQGDSGAGGGTGRIDLNRPRIVQERIYVVPRSGATLFVTCEYVQAEHELDVVFRYVDRTALGVTYPTDSHIVGREPGGYSAGESIELPKSR